ncbi:MAG: PKD domain-containing protein, partial [bacterium]|nr:PKD domain-containing protein [bacterium]
RLGVSTNVAADNETGAAPSYNVHTIFHLDEDDIVFAYSMYGETIISHGKLGEPEGSKTREKHADIAVDDNYVHYIWQRKNGFPYWEMHQKAENKLGGAWSEITQLTFQEEPWASQRARIALDSDGYFHFTEFNKNINDNKKMKYRVEQPDGSLSEYVNLSNPGKIELYHYAELVIRDNTKNLDENGAPGDLSVFASMQKGQSKEHIGGKAIIYSWKQNGVWSLFNSIPDTLQCLHQSADLSPDGDQAAVAWLKLTKAVILSVSSPIVEIPVGPPPPPPPPPTVPLDVKFVFTAPVFYNSPVTFDASQCITLNPKANITGYRWDFGDAVIETTQSPTITHTYNQYGINYTVNLTVFSDSEETEDSGSTTATIFTNALYSIEPSSVSVESQRSLFFQKVINTVNWEPNQKNSDAEYTIAKYKLLRAEGNGNNYADYIQIAELNTGTVSYRDSIGLKANTTYTYYIICVDEAGHESIFGRI